MKRREKQNYSSLKLPFSHSSLKPRSLKLPPSYLNQLPRTQIVLKRGSHKKIAPPPDEPLPKWARVLLDLENNGQGVPVKQLNLTLKGEPVLWLEEWLKRGLCQDVAEAVSLAFKILHEHTVKQDIQEQQLKTLRHFYGAGHSV